MIAKIFFNNKQFGFRGKHNTTDQLSRLVNDITENFNKKLPYRGFDIGHCFCVHI